MEHEFELFVAKLFYLGGTVTSKLSVDFSSEPLNLEAFFLEGTIYARRDVRVGQSFEHWVRRYGPFLSPSRIRRIIRDNHVQYDPVYLGILIELLESLPGNLQSFGILKNYVKKIKKKELFYDHLNQPKNLDPLYLKYGYQKLPFHKDEKKFLKKTEFVLNNCPELSYRLIGIPALVSDVKVWLEKKPGISKYQISRKGYYDISRVIKVTNQLKDTIHRPVELLS